MNVDLEHLLIFVIPGFILVWSFRHFTKSEKRMGDFEYAAFSLFWGLVLLAIQARLVPDDSFKNILGNPYAAALSFSVLGFFAAVFFGKVLPWVTRLGIKLGAGKDNDQIDGSKISAFSIGLLGVIIFCALVIWRGGLPDPNWEAISAVILAITAIFIAIQAWATKDMVHNSLRPLVEVSLLSDNAKTYVQLINMGKSPAYVWVKISFKVGGKKVDDKPEPRLNGDEPWRIIFSAYRTNELNFFSNLIEKYRGSAITATLEISLAPLFKPKLKSLFYMKDYNYSYSTQTWDDSHWGVPDQLDPRLQEYVEQHSANAGRKA